jgi:hypothetical protein
MDWIVQQILEVVVGKGDRSAACSQSVRTVPYIFSIRCKRRKKKARNESDSEVLSL